MLDYACRLLFVFEVRDTRIEKRGRIWRKDDGAQLFLGNIQAWSAHQGTQVLQVCPCPLELELEIDKIEPPSASVALAKAFRIIRIDARMSVWPHAYGLK